ncbi:MAG TPA: hypothetical protein VJS47_05070 [Rhizomicrobium sp.]|nr:hypothetical protein [Rhizomicrobium sp.]
MIGVLFWVPLLLFMAIQGAVVFATARWSLRFLKVSHWFGKITAMSISYTAWIVFTIAGYTVLGGEGGLMDGFGLVLFLCFTAMISSFVYLVAWILRASQNGQEPEDEALIEPWS